MHTLDQQHVPDAIEVPRHVWADIAFRLMQEALAHVVLDACMGAKMCRFTSYLPSSPPVATLFRDSIWARTVLRTGWVAVTTNEERERERERREEHAQI